MIYNKGSDATNKSNQNLSLLDAGQLAYQISFKACGNHSTISMLPSKYFPHQYKPSGDYPLKLSAAGTHCAQQLISSWKAGNAAPTCQSSCAYQEPTSHIMCH